MSSPPSPWSDSPVEVNVSSLINERLKYWKSTLATFLKFFEDWMSIESTYSGSLRKLTLSLAGIQISDKSDYQIRSPSVSSSKSSHDSTLFHDTIDAAAIGTVTNHLKRSVSDTEAFYRFLKETVTSKLVLLKDNLQKLSSSVKRDIREAESKINSRKEGLSHASIEHQKALNLRNKELKAASSSDIQDIPDIFLTEQTLKECTLRFLQEKTQYNAILMDCFRKVKTMDLEISSNLKDLFSESMRVREQLLNATSSALAQEFDTLNSLDPHSSWNQSIVNHNLDWDWSVEIPPFDGFFASIISQIACALSSDDLEPFIPKEVKITKSGFLLRPGTFSISWNLFFCVLTDSGFLHCFAAPTGNSHDNTVKPIRLPSSDSKLHLKALQDLNKSAYSLWLMVENKSILELLGSPVISIPVMHSDTLVTPISGNSNDPCFMIQTPGSGTFFGKSERKFQFKSFVDEDMVEWCIAIKSAQLTPPLKSALEDTKNTSPPLASFPDPFAIDDAEGSFGGPGEEEIPTFRERSPTDPIPQSIPSDNPWG